MRRAFFVSIVSLFAGLSVACAVEPADDVSSEEIGEAQQALANNGNDPLFGTVCRACGCTYESYVGKDGCTRWRCVCDTEAERDCVLKAPGGSAMEVPPPPPRPPIFNPPIVATPIFAAP